VHQVKREPAQRVFEGHAMLHHQVGVSLATKLGVLFNADF
jgi:hypothetical protein